MFPPRHTAADYETAMRAFHAGATHATHLFNAMPSLHHREPGVIAAACDAGAAVTAATYAPAKAIGMENKIGSIEKGFPADFVLLDEALNVIDVFADGKSVR
ncbi:MAG: amidohydrolase family protein [Clostridia bacterium]|nr:amidohydrolase family protein [Clostridia bacterium]